MKIIAAVVVVIVACALIWLVAAHGDKMASDLHWLAHLRVHLKARLTEFLAWVKKMESLASLRASSIDYLCSSSFSTMATPR